ncbi:MAG: MBL fold metallo-hydrolase [Proteobacteria bacterium]|nr:MBL fold metallo-hydrolase [Pseudomonadota bacterium]
MELQLIRNATMKLTYAGSTILTDPMLVPKDKFAPFAGLARNPTVDLPFPAEEVAKGLDAVVVSHDHIDHFDKKAGAILPKDIPLFCQPGDEARMSGDGFRTVMPVDTTRTWKGITITRTGGLHGQGKILEFTGMVSGFVFQADDEPTVYWTGDTIWCDPVAEAVAAFRPDVIVTHSGGARLPNSGFIIMNDEQTLELLRAAPKAAVVAVHLEALDHCTVTRQALRDLADRQGIPPSRLMIPADGETLGF